MDIVHLLPSALLLNRKTVLNILARIVLHRSFHNATTINVIRTVIVVLLTKPGSYSYCVKQELKFYHYTNDGPRRDTP